MRPAKDALLQAAATYPFSTVCITFSCPQTSGRLINVLQLFSAIFLILSVFPLVIFLGWCLFSGSIILFLSLAFLAVTATVVIGSAAVLLAGTLAFAFAISIGVTLAAASAIISYRLLVNVRNSGSLVTGSKVYTAILTEAEKWLTHIIRPASRMSSNISRHQVLRSSRTAIQRRRHWTHTSSSRKSEFAVVWLQMCSATPEGSTLETRECIGTSSRRTAEQPPQHE